MSTSFYRQSMIPVLLARFESPATSTANSALHRPFIHVQKKIEVWNTSCIVTNFGKNQPKTSCSILINPANDTLTGTSQFPYFPRFVYFSHLYMVVFYSTFILESIILFFQSLGYCMTEVDPYPKNDLLQTFIPIGNL